MFEYFSSSNMVYITKLQSLSNSASKKHINSHQEDVSIF